MMTLQTLNEGAIRMFKSFGDAASYSIAFGAVLKVIPPIAGLISIVWVGFQFYHHPVVKEWRERRKVTNGNS